MTIKHTSFKHGWFYHYRVHCSKTDGLCRGGLCSLKEFLNSMFDNCPDDYFSSGPRASSLKMPVKSKIHEIYGHEISSLAKGGLLNKRYKTAHSNVQVFMLKEDDKTLAVEVPLWLMPSEFKGFNDAFSSNEPLTGHIDVLRVEDDNVWIWDYKPNADKENYANTQVFFYALMLSKRTKIPLNKIRCGYFDDEVAYVFKPENADV